MDNDQAKGSGQDLAGKAKEAANEMWDAGRDKVEGVKQQAAGATNQAYGAAKDMTNQAVEAGQAYYDDGVQALGRQVAASPLSSLVVAGMFGAIVGWACRARMDHSDYRTRR
ncbi:MULTISPECIES: CsbD family protein [unclassified Chelatococcus]|uniref:CsbD family protein n=1 Tax=unclassified Chelatococcus TaxID=2638111 RepID=UPI001BCC993A|nr:MULTISPECIES: CsbD family protein [unclassified Chelatococcus]MBS7700057.1 CsbD family protein [Chelatococcus sp. YT9]MBX3556750.1 CsbD family protein [Chelatococcus sp.]